MWTCMIHVPFEKTITQRKDERAKVTDWDAWAAKLQQGETLEIARDITARRSTAATSG
ncbi:MAG: hypothetical protein WDO13_17425 [Verrucomicrobiota bacterium]